MNVLVTGGGGFIGSHLVESQLGQGHRVRTVDLHFDRLVHLQNGPSLEIIMADITDSQILTSLVKDIDLVFHLASAHLDVNLPETTFRNVNVTATHSLLDAARQAGVQRFVHCSSVGVMGDIENPPANETTPCRPSNIYEQTKLEGEITALTYHQKTGFPVVVLRPAWVYGPRCPRTEKLLRMVKRGRFFFFGKGMNLRHPIHVRDCILGFELASQAKDVDGQVYILAGKSSVTTMELIKVAAECLQVAVRPIHFPLSLGKAAGRLIQSGFGFLGKQPPFSERSLDFFTKNNAYSIDKAQREMGFNPEIDLSMGLNETVHWINNA